MLDSKTTQIISFSPNRLLPPTSPAGLLSSVQGHSHELGEYRQPRDVRASAMSSISQRDFIHNLSHEIKTPLASMQLLAEGIQDGVFAADSENMGKLLENIKRIDDTLQAMLRYSTDLPDDDAGFASERTQQVVVTSPMRFSETAARCSDESQKAERHNQRCCIKSALSLACKSAASLGDKKGIKVSSSLSCLSTQEQAPLSKTKLMEIVNELTDNAFRHAAGMSKLDIRARYADDAAPGSGNRDGDPDKRSRRYHDFLEITVEDDGCGMAEDMRDKAFIPFWKGDESHSSTTETGLHTSPGLGLSIAKEETRKAGGTISIQEGDRGGTKVIIRLPVWSIGKDQQAA